MRSKLPTKTTARVIVDWPPGEWLTEGQVAEALPDAHDATLGDDGWEVDGGRSLVSVLSEARRCGWLVRNRHVDPPVYARTTQGAFQAADVLEVQGSA